MASERKRGRGRGRLLAIDRKRRGCRCWCARPLRSRGCLRPRTYLLLVLVLVVGLGRVLVGGGDLGRGLLITVAVAAGGVNFSSGVWGKKTTTQPDTGGVRGVSRQGRVCVRSRWLLARSIAFFTRLLLWCAAADKLFNARGPLAPLRFASLCVAAHLSSASSGISPLRSLSTSSA